MKLTKRWLEGKNACLGGIRYFESLKTTSIDELFNNAIKDERFSDTNWVISRKLKRKDKIRYAVFAAKQVIDIYEEKYPDDNRPRKAIEAAERCIEKDIKNNRAAAADAAYAYAAADAAYADAAYAAYADAAAAAAYTAAAAADAAYAYAYAAAAYAAADAAAYAYADAAYVSNDVIKKEMYVKILTYGFELLKGVSDV